MKKLKTKVQVKRDLKVVQDLIKQTIDYKINQVRLLCNPNNELSFRVICLDSRGNILKGMFNNLDIVTLVSNLPTCSSYLETDDDVISLYVYAISR